MARDLAQELDNTPDEPTVLWKPQPGDTLVGIVRTIDTVPSKFSEARQDRLVIETDDGELVTVYARHTFLARELAEEAPGVGDRIAIKRLQDMPGKAYRRYKVLVDHVPDPYDDPSAPVPDGDDFNFPASEHDES